MGNDTLNQLEEFFAQEESHIPVYGEPKPGISAEPPKEELKPQIPLSSGGNDPLLTPERECKIVRDLLPLYADEACSLYTKDFVNRHLSHCSECKYTLANMETDIGISIITDAEANLRRLKKSMFKKQTATIALLTAFFTSVLCAFAFYFIAGTVRTEVSQEYEQRYYQAVNNYKEELEKGDPIDNLEQKLWEMAETIE